MSISRQVRRAQERQEEKEKAKLIKQLQLSDFTYSADDKNPTLSAMGPQLVDFMNVIGLSRSLKEHVHIEKRVRWVSDKQDAFVTAIAAEFPNTAHRYCNNHFLRDLAKPVLEKDSRAKVQMRRKVRGLRSIEKEVLEELDQSQKEDEQLNPEQKKYASSIVLDYCAAVRGIFNDNHGGPLRPPGLRMADALEEVSKSLERNLRYGKTPISSKLKRLNECIKRGLAACRRI